MWLLGLPDFEIIALSGLEAMHNQFPGQDVDKLIAKLPDALAVEGAEDAPKETVI